MTTFVSIVLIAAIVWFIAYICARDNKAADRVQDDKDSAGAAFVLVIIFGLAFYIGWMIYQAGQSSGIEESYGYSSSQNF